MQPEEADEPYVKGNPNVNFMIAFIGNHSLPGTLSGPNVNSHFPFPICMFFLDKEIGRKSTEVASGKISSCLEVGAAAGIELWFGVESSFVS